MARTGVARHESLYRVLFLDDPDRSPATSFTTYVIDSVTLQLPPTRASNVTAGCERRRDS